MRQIEVVKKRIVVGFMIAYTLSWLYYTAFYTWVAPNKNAMILCIPGAMSSFLALVLVHFKQEKIATIIANGVAILALTAIVGFTGHFYSTIAIYPIVAILTAFLLNGFLVGIACVFLLSDL